MVPAKKYASLDYFRLFCAFCIIGIHTSPLLSVNETADFVATRIVFRIAVPFFFMSTGYFMDFNNLKQSVSKLANLYALAILLYLPLNIYTGYFSKPALGFEMLKDILFDGTFYHLWYFPAVIIGILILAIFKKTCNERVLIVILFLLYAIGLFGDSYYGIASQIPAISKLYGHFFIISDYTRNGLFFAPLYIGMGVWIARNKSLLNTRSCVTGLTACALLLLTEGLLLHHGNIQRHDSMYIMLVPCMYFLFHLLLRYNGKSIKTVRNLSLIIYLVHPWMIILVRGAAKFMHLEKLLVENSIIHYLSVAILSLLVSYIFARYCPSGKKKEIAEARRAWVEINLEALRHNIKVLKGSLPKRCKIMAVVKANAYGHGDVEISTELNKVGIRHFAVATVSEGIHLRKNGIKGEILVLGYTPPEELESLVHYGLSQTILGKNYAEVLDKTGLKIKVHVKLDTGMHRLGMDCQDTEEIERIYSYKNLVFKGIFTHLCSADILEKEEVRFTDRQIKLFFKTVSDLRSKGIDVGKVHAQSSYGVLNYPELPCDYARIGIAMYGILSSHADTLVRPDLFPVLSVKAKIMLVREVGANESVGYGRTYKASKNMRIAIVSIGYADGIPRNLSSQNGYVLVKSKKAPIIGRICMDQFTVDISEIEGVRPNDVVTVIGRDGHEEIRCEDFAVKSGTISNEILSRLGNRLEYLYLESR